MEHIINPVYYQDFILAGNCEFTIRSLRTGNEEMFVVKKARNDDKVYWVSNRTRELIGVITLVRADENIWDFSKKQGKLLAYQEGQVEIFNWLWGRILAEIVPQGKMEIINPYNRCAHCHRPLTHPESIPIGIGPDCFKKLNLTHKKLI